MRFNFTIGRFYKKNLFYSISILLGFTISIAVSTLIFSLINYERSTDSSHEDSDKIYRLLMSDPVTRQVGLFTFSYLPEKLLSFPEIQSTTHLYYPGRLHINVNNINYAEESSVYADSSLLSIFNLNLVRGDRKRAMIKPRTVLLNAKTAIKYFGKTAVVGETIEIKNDIYEVSGVFSDLYNSHLKLDLVISKASLPPAKFAFDYAGVTYIKVKPNVKISNLQAKLEKNQNVLLPMPPEKPITLPFIAQPIKEIYFSEVYSNDYLKPIFRLRDSKFLSILSSVGIIILLLSLFNYAIFSTATSNFQIKEVIIKKIYGASFSVVARQKISESLFIVLIAAILSISVTYSLVPVVGEVLQSGIESDYIFNPAVIIFLLFLVTIFSVLIGLLNASGLWKQKSGISSSLSAPLKTNPFKALNTIIVAQLAICTALVSFTLIVLNQLRFVKEKPIGFTKENIIEIPLSELPVGSNIAAMKQQFLQLSSVVSASLCIGSPLTYPSGKVHISRLI